MFVNETIMSHEACWSESSGHVVAFLCGCITNRFVSLLCCNVPCVVSWDPVLSTKGDAIMCRRLNILATRNFGLRECAICHFYIGFGYGAIGFGFDVQVYRSSGD